MHAILVLIKSVSSKCSGKTAHMRRLTRAFAAYLHNLDVDVASG